MVNDSDAPRSLDSVAVSFDDQRSVADAGLILPGTLADVSGSTGKVLGHRVMAHSTLGSFLRAFTFGHVRQLDRVLGEAIAPGAPGKIDAIEVAAGKGPELEERFARRATGVESTPGFLGFELLRPMEGETRYFVYTRWGEESEEAFRAWG